jgi:hypothetical protein
MNAAPAIRFTTVADSVFGRALPVGSILFIGGIMGIVSGADMQGRGEPLLYFIVPACFMKYIVAIWKFMKYPREHSWPFILGISYNERTKLAIALLHRELPGFITLAFGSCAFYLICQSVGHRHAVVMKPALNAVIMSVEGILLYLCVVSAIKTGILSPVKKDCAGNAAASGNTTAHSSGHLVYIVTSRLAGYFLPEKAAVLAGRQAMYLIRADLFSLSIFPAVAIIISGILLHYLGKNGTAIADIVTTTAPFLLMIDRTEVFDESVSRLYSCPYYDVNIIKTDMFLSGLFFAILVCLPFMLLYTASVIFSDERNAGIIWQRTASFLSGWTAGIYIMSNRWIKAGWIDGTAALAGTALICMVLARMIPVFGPLFPVLLTVAAFLILSKDKKCE